MPDKKYVGFYISENILDFPGQLAITKLSFPRLFLRFEYNDESLFAYYNTWKSNLIIIEWLDPKEKPKSEVAIDAVLTDCWNFLALTEAEEERLYDLTGGYTDDLDL
jgi:hypothetical protein